MPTVRTRTFEVLRQLGLTRMFANPGSTEIPFLAQLPPDIEFVLALHEASVVGMASGQALATGEPALAVVHTTAGLGNAVSAIATARDNAAPLVVLVGQQDRRHLALNPFLAGRLEGLAGRYPVSFDLPARPQDVPAAIARAWHEARHARGPAIVVVPMDDWDADADPDVHAAPSAVVQGTGIDVSAVSRLADLLNEATSPCLVVGAAADSPSCWDALVRLAERMDCPVFQEAFGARAGFPQDHPRFAGYLPANRPGLRDTLAPHDVVLSVGAAVFRQYPYAQGPLVHPGTRLALVTDRVDDAHRAPAELVLLGDPAGVVRALVELAEPRTNGPATEVALELPPPPSQGSPLRAAHVLAALGLALPAESVVVEETPSSRPLLQNLVPARSNLGFVSAANGGLGFALPASVGIRMAAPERPVIAVVGDGSSLYSFQALWSAAHYDVGVVVVVLANGGYAIMDRLAEQAGATQPAWPAFPEIDVAALARALGCPSRTVTDLDELNQALDDIVPTLKTRTEPVLLQVHVATEPGYQA